MRAKNAPLSVNLMTTCYIQVLFSLYILCLRPFRSHTPGSRYTHTFIRTMNIFPNAECVMRKEEFIIIDIVFFFVQRRKKKYELTVTHLCSVAHEQNIIHGKKFMFHICIANRCATAKKLKIQTEATMMMVFYRRNLLS